MVYAQQLFSRAGEDTPVTLTLIDPDNQKSTLFERSKENQMAAGA